MILSALGPGENLVGGRMDAGVPGDGRFAGADGDNVDHPPRVPVRVKGTLDVVQAVEGPVLPRLAVDERPFDWDVGEEESSAVGSGQMLSVGSRASFFRKRLFAWEDGFGTEVQVFDREVNEVGH